VTYRSNFPDGYVDTNGGVAVASVFIVEDTDIVQGYTQISSVFSPTYRNHHRSCWQCRDCSPSCFSPGCMVVSRLSQPITLTLPRRVIAVPSRQNKSNRSMVSGGS
jgi:hypothetical protein